MKDAAGYNHYSVPPFDRRVAFGEGGQIEPVTDGRDSEACVVRLKERFGYNTEEAHEVIDEVHEAFQDDAHEQIREAFGKAHELEDRAWIKLQTYVKNNGDFFLALKCCLLLLGFPTAAGAGSQVGLVKLFSKENDENVMKQAVNKCIGHFKRKLPELPYFVEQRNKAARKRMSHGRINQLTK